MNLPMIQEILGRALSQVLRALTLSTNIKSPKLGTKSFELSSNNESFELGTKSFELSSNIKSLELVLRLISGAEFRD